MVLISWSDKQAKGKAVKIAEVFRRYRIGSTEWKRQ